MAKLSGSKGGRIRPRTPSGSKGGRARPSARTSSGSKVKR